METNELPENPRPNLDKVVFNVEEQYSIGSDDKDIPIGWTYVGVTGTQMACRAYIETVWTDMLPLSLQQLMAEQGKK